VDWTIGPSSSETLGELAGGSLRYGFMGSFNLTKRSLRSESFIKTGLKKSR
jgi:hypothetical protein